MFFITPITIFCLVFIIPFSDGFTFVDSWEMGLLYAQYIFLPCLIIWGQFELCNRGYWAPWYFRWLVQLRKQFELNRRTGMVTLYKGVNKVRFSHPFIEFDCVLVSAPTQQGMMRYSLVLVHRYNGSKFSVPISNLIGNGGMVIEYHRLWNTVQRYMDVSQPLPDTLVLEESREKDPTTVAFDQKSGRKADYWRSMSDETYRKTTHHKIIYKQIWGSTPIDIFKGHNENIATAKPQT